jgi:hypothetical protein
MAASPANTDVAQTAIAIFSLICASSFTGYTLFSPRYDAMTPHIALKSRPLTITVTPSIAVSGESLTTLRHHCPVGTAVTDWARLR